MFALVGAALIGLGSTVQLATTVVHDRLLKPALYEDVLDREHVFTRIYSQVLTDPAVRAATSDLLGGLKLGSGRTVADATSLSNALARLALPPATLRDATRHVIETVLAYLRGDTTRIDSRVDLSAALQLDASANAALVGVLQTASTRVLLDLPSYEAAVRAFADELAAGRVPDNVPVIGGNEVSGAEIVAAIESAGRYGLPDALVNQIVAAVQSGDERDALISASAAFVQSHVAVLSNELHTGTDLRIDLIDVLGRQAGQPQQTALAQLNSIRRIAADIPPWTSFAAIAILAVGLALCALAGGPSRRRALATAGSFSLAAGVVWIVRMVAGTTLTSPLARAASAGGDNRLPTSVVVILHDIDGALQADLVGVVNRRIAILCLIAAGFAALAGGLSVIQWVRRTDWRIASAIGVVGAIVIALLVPWLRSAGTAAHARECNGHSELCDRRYDHVVQAATHNSMSSPDVVQIWPEHDSNIEAQLNYGIRTLLIDTSYWTQIATPSELSTVEQFVPNDIATYLYSNLDERLRAHPGTYLCHSRCAYGAVPFASSLSTIKQFLDRNPDEVVTLVIQNGITATDTEAAFDASGISPYLYRGEPTGNWPTLGELIDAGQRLVVFAETGRPPPDWYHAYADLFQDTEYHVPSVAAMSCALNRGRPDAPLFMLNNWIQREAPDRADAAQVNQRAFIVERARQCGVARGQLPNFIAVNFFTIGDVLGAVDDLNGTSVAGDEKSHPQARGAPQGRQYLLLPMTTTLSRHRRVRSSNRRNHGDGSREFESAWPRRRG
jgi:hypothetical protein